MIVLDTNVLSAVMQRQPDEAVVAWLDAQLSESVWTTTITMFEVRFGIQLLANGRRRQQLQAAFDRMLEEDFEDRILAFDRDAALEAARLAAERRAAGKTVDFRDVEIAGIVASRRATLATRNTKPFRELGIDLVDPRTQRAPSA